jgi:hypothetical protein
VKTDHPVYLFLSAGAEAFRVLTGGRELDGAYRFCSLTIKGLERRLDGIFEPEGHAGPVYVVEFQGQSSEKAWYNLLTPIQETKAHQSILAEGKIEGKAESLKRLLTRRYGPLPAWAEQRIDAATAAQLDGWLDGIFDAANLEDLIGPASG